MSTQTHPIRVAATRSGLTPDVLRAWEKRYGAVTPQRIDGRRLYSDDDIQRLILLRRATLAGRRIGDVASLPTRELAHMDAGDREAMAEAPRAASRQPPAGSLDTPPACKAACMQAVLSFDGQQLRTLLEQSAVSLGQIRLLDEVILPVMQELGEMWRRGDARIAQEHMATEVLQSFLTSLRAAQAADVHAPRILVTTLPGQHHELGALVVAATAASEGWNVSYLGPNLPTEEIAAAINGTGARAVALSLVYPADDPRLGENLLTLRRQIGDAITVIVGGPAAGSYGQAMKKSSALWLRDMASLRALLASMRMRPDNLPQGSLPATNKA